MKLLATLAVPVVLAVGGAAWKLGYTTPEQEVPAYETTAISVGSIRRLVATSGPVRAVVTVSIGSELSGKVVDVMADFNKEVTKGELLALIDPKTFATKVAQAKADLAVAEAALANQRAALRKAQAVMKEAALGIERQRVLSKRGYASKATLATATRDIEVAKAEIAVAEAQIQSAQATILQRQAQLKQTEIDFDRTRIISPINGTVISRTVDIGQTVAASLQAPELFKIAQDLRRIRIEAQVNEADVGAISEGNSATFSVDAYPERTFNAKVTQLRLAATELNNVVTYTVVLEADNDDRRLFPGMTANVQIETAKRDNARRLTAEALRYKPRGDVATQTVSGSGGQRGGRALARLKDQLGLSDEQVASVRNKMKAAGGGARGGDAAGDPAARQAQRAKRAKALDAALKAILTEKQLATYAKIKRGREGVRTATVWVLDGEGRPAPRRVRVGITDDRFVEVVGGALKDEEQVITRARRVR